MAAPRAAHLRKIPLPLILGTPKVTKIAEGKGVLVEQTSPFLSDPEILGDFLKTSKVVDATTRVAVSVDAPVAEALESIEVESVFITPIEEEL